MKLNKKKKEKNIKIKELFEEIEKYMKKKFSN